MRRDRIIVSLLASSISQMARASQVVSFDDSDFSDGTLTPAIFSQVQNNDSQARQFNFHSSEAVSIEYISLYMVASQAPASGILIAQWSSHGAVSGGNDGGNGGLNSNTPIITKTPGTGPAATTSPSPFVISQKRDLPTFPQQQSTPIILSTSITSPLAGTVVIQNLYPNGTFVNSALYLVANWSISNTNEVGSSSSREFIFTNYSPTTCPDDGLSDASWCSLASLISASPNPVLPDATSTAASTAGLTGATPNASLTSASGVGSPLTGPSSSTSNHLSTGAIVGIAVGCGFAGLIILCTVACILLRRHKRRQNLRESSPVPFGARSRTEELIAEKEANAGVTETPHSPYSDDGMPGDSAGAAAAVRRERSHPNGVINTNVERSYTPYSDNRSSVPALSPAVAAASSSQHNTEEQRHSVARSATPQGVSGRYAHLVEEGMTEDDIRRLEEEERQLDAAIERSGRAH